MKSNIVSTIKYIAFLAVGIVLLWLAFRNENLAEVWDKIKVADPFWLSLSVVIALFAFWSRAVRWIMLMEPLGYKPRLSTTLYALFLGYFANLAIPRIGEFTRCGSLANTDQVPFNALLGTVIVERVIDLIMLLVVMVLVAMLEFDLLTSFLQEKVVGPMSEKLPDGTNAGLWLAVLTAAVAAAGIFLLYRKLTRDPKSKLAIKIKGITHEIASGFKTILRMKKNGWFLFHTIFIWLMYFLMTWVCFFCLDSTSHLDMKSGLFILVVGGLGMSAPVQGGIGAYHYIVSQGLQLFGISSTDGIAYATLVHTTQTLLVVVLGIFALVMLFLLKNKKTTS